MSSVLVLAILLTLFLAVSPVLAIGREIQISHGWKHGSMKLNDIKIQYF